MCDCVSRSRPHLSPNSFDRNARPGMRLREAGRSGRLFFHYAALLAVLLVAACPWLNGQNPSVMGQFSSVMSWPFNPTHAVLLPSGKVLWWASFAYGGRPEIWDPIAN